MQDLIEYAAILGIMCLIGFAAYGVMTIVDVVRYHRNGHGHRKENLVLRRAKERRRLEKELEAYEWKNDRYGYGRDFHTKVEKMIDGDELSKNYNLTGAQHIPMGLNTPLNGWNADHVSDSALDQFLKDTEKPRPLSPVEVTIADDPDFIEKIEQMGNDAEIPHQPCFPEDDVQKDAYYPPSIVEGLIDDNDLREFAKPDFYDRLTDYALNEDREEDGRILPAESESDKSEKTTGATSEFSAILQSPHFHERLRQLLSEPDNDKELTNESLHVDAQNDREGSV